MQSDGSEDRERLRLDGVAATLHDVEDDSDDVFDFSQGVSYTAAPAAAVQAVAAQAVAAQAVAAQAVAAQAVAAQADATQAIATPQAAGATPRSPGITGQLRTHCGRLFRWLYGGEDDEAIRFMEPTSTVDPISLRRAVIAALLPKEYADLERANFERVAACPIVTKVRPLGKVHERQGVQVTLKCGVNCCQARQSTKWCGAHVPTKAQAAEMLLDMLSTEHEDCINWKTHFPDEQAGSSSGVSAPSHLMEVQRRTAEAVAAQKRQEKAHAILAGAMAAELKAVQEREAAEEAVRELRGSVQQQKRQHTDEQRTDATDAWTVSRWRKHETEAQKRRAVPIDDSNVAELFPPRGDETRGWRMHWRRGLVGTLCDWAEGSTISRSLHARRDGHPLQV